MSNCVLVCVSYEQTNIIMIQKKYGWYCKRVLVYRPEEALEMDPFILQTVSGLMPVFLQRENII